MKPVELLGLYARMDADEQAAFVRYGRAILDGDDPLNVKVAELERRADWVERKLEALGQRSASVAEGARS